MQLAATVRRYYVATNGSDSNSGSKTQPWKTVYAAINKMTTGGTLYVRGGTYSYSGENIIGARRTSTTRIIVTNYPGETPVFKTTSTQAIFMWFRNAGNITVQHLVGLRRPEQPDAHQPRRRDLPVHRAIRRASSSAGTRRYGGPNWANTQHGVYIGAGTVRDITIKWNLFDGQGGDGAGFHAYHDPNGLRIAVRDNTFRQLGHLHPGLVQHPLARASPGTPSRAAGSASATTSRAARGVTRNRALTNSISIQRDTRSYLRASSTTPGTDPASARGS